MPSCPLRKEHLVAPFPGLASSNCRSCLRTAQVYQSAWSPNSLESPSRPPLDPQTGRGGCKEDSSLQRPRTERFRETEGSGHPWQRKSSFPNAHQSSILLDVPAWSMEKGKMPDPLHEIQTMPPEQESQQNRKAKLHQTRSQWSKAIPSRPDVARVTMMSQQATGPRST